jgi:hypothetical protein
VATSFGYSVKPSSGNTKNKQRKTTFFIFLFCVFVILIGCDEAKEKIREDFWQLWRKKETPLLFTRNTQNRVAV